MNHRTESVVRAAILLVIGGMAGAAAFTHVHDLSVAHGQPDWIGWANAVAIELMAIFLGLELRARRRAGRPVGLVASFLVAFALLSLAAQVAEAETSVWGWIVAAVPSLAFLALVKVVLPSAPVTPTAAKRPLPEPALVDVDQADPQAVPPAGPLAVPTRAAEPAAPVPSPPRPVHPSRPAVVGIIR